MGAQSMNFYLIISLPNEEFIGQISREVPIFIGKLP